MKYLAVFKFPQGTLQIDPVARTLSVESPGRSSGGETTYAMVALLIALQECVDLPFFFMDEFDVYLVCIF